MALTLENLEFFEQFIIYMFVYYVSAVVVWWIGKIMNDSVKCANGGQMPVVPNHPGDREYFGFTVEQSERHKWADDNTKLSFLTDRFNAYSWEKCPIVLAELLSRYTRYDILGRQKISIGDIFIWTGMLMWFTGIALLMCLMVLMLIFIIPTLL